ncbi:MAG: hypothetical protein JRG67_07915 [Deltaproteobacteria bacterium]|nr:hypothetical protein [Deltaproteobacteria bacterium]MBW1874021.1 hypothetical protein [Deltaproteobacteria bacterium]MBW2210960.1 hypothetical protein [Deltaproteobacteria bacterium]MBW2213152.1 hypothetical protein [Deltaproteobacteria bacterium]MBW2378738.1 hypothetical protein [Deltaproteobacteria bacterium]
MNVCRSQRWAAALVMFLAGGLLAGALGGCSGRKQVPFGLQDAGAPVELEAETGEAVAELPVGAAFAPNQVEVQVAESTLVLQAGYALAALQLDLDGSEPNDALVVSADPQEVRLQAAYPRGLDVTTRSIDSFLVPSHCTEPAAEIRQLSESLVGVRVDHVCETGKRSNFWLVTIEAQPRVRERITVLPPNDRSTAAIELELRVEDRDADGYDDVVANVRIGQTEVPLAWLNRPGGFARDASQPEATFRELADTAWGSLDSDPAGAKKHALAVIDAFVALCRESGAARIGLSGTHGLQCQQSPATARAVAVAITAAIRRGSFVRALELQRWWEATATRPTPEERELVQAAWRKAKATATATWRAVGKEGSPVSLYFRDADTLVIDGRSPRAIQLSSGSETRLSEAEVMPPVRDPEGRYAVRSVRVTCVGFEAEVGPIRSKQTHRVLIERRSGNAPCKTPIDRPASVFEWAVLGWAPQGLVAASGDLLRVVPLNAFAKPAGGPIDLSAGSPLPAPIRGARITADGSRYVIPHSEGVVVRDWRKGGAGLWLRPADWNAVPGELRSVAISPDGRRVAVQKGNEIRVLTW